MAGEKAQAIQRNVLMNKGCTECGSNSDFTLWEKAGQTWYSCSRKIGGQYCPGRPADDAVPVETTGSAPPATPTPPPEGAPSQAAPSGGSSGPTGYADLFDKLGDCLAEASSIFTEIAHRMGGGS